MTSWKTLAENLRSLSEAEPRMDQENEELKLPLSQMFHSKVLVQDKNKLLQQRETGERREGFTLETCCCALLYIPTCDFSRGTASHGMSTV